MIIGLIISQLIYRINSYRPDNKNPNNKNIPDKLYIFACVNLTLSIMLAISFMLLLGINDNADKWHLSWLTAITGIEGIIAIQKYRSQKALIKQES